MGQTNRCYKQEVTAPPANEPFTNEPIPIDAVPQLTDDAFVSVDPRYLRVSLAGAAAVAAVVLIGGSVLAWQAEDTVVVAGIAGVILLLIAVSAALRVLEVRRLAYQVREHDISMRSGVISHRVESLPFARVQHVRVNRGAIERGLGLSTLQISSAGPNITIPGLAEADASRIKLLVTQRAGMDIEDDSTPATPIVAGLPPAVGLPGSAPTQPPVIEPQGEPPTR